MAREGSDYRSIEIADKPLVSESALSNPCPKKRSIQSRHRRAKQRINCERISTINPLDTQHRSSYTSNVRKYSLINCLSIHTPIGRFAGRISIVAHAPLMGRSCRHGESFMKPSPGSLPLRLHIRNGVALLLMALLTLNAYPSHAQLFKAVPDRAESLVRSISASHDVSSLKPRRAGASPTPFAISISAPSRDKKATETDTESAPGTPHKIGFGRNVPQLASVADTATCLQWQSTAQVGMIAAISISSPEAVGIRLGILVHRLPAEATVRFYNQEAETAYEISGEDIMESIQRKSNAGDDGDAALTYWSPNIEGEEATLEIELPPGIDPDTVEISIPLISHFFRSPLAAQGKASSIK